jgi:hypothetical protein
MILATHLTPTLTQERYDEVVRRLTGGKAKIEAPEDLPFDGLLAHASGQGPNGFFVFDVFASQAAVSAFQGALGSMPREVGIAQPPAFFRAHTVYLP